MSQSIEEEDCYSRPTLRQVNAIVDFIQEHPILAQCKRKKMMNHDKLKKLWVEMSNKVNAIGGVEKSTKSWIKYWMDKRRYVLLKHRRIQIGKSKLRLSKLEKKILNISSDAKKNNEEIEQDHTNNYYEEGDSKENNDNSKYNGIETHISVEGQEKYVKMLENVADIMEKQSTAYTQMAQTWYSHSSAMGRLADAAYQQAVAVGRLANSFETIGTSLFDIKNAVVNIDDVLKRSFTATIPDQHNGHLFA